MSTDLQRLVDGWPVGWAGVAVVDPSGERGAVGGDVVAPWASVTKIVTALAVLDAAADGDVELDDPAGPPGSTLRHLLGHASGLPFEGDEPVSAVGTRRTYSNTGYEAAAAHVATAVGQPFADVVRERVLDPLAMDTTTLAGSPAHGVVGTVADLGRLAAELLAPRTLQGEIVAQSATLAFPGLEGVLPGYGRQRPNDWGLGCEIRGAKEPHWTSPANSARTFGHFGQAGGFLWVDPDAGLGCVTLSDTPFGPWAVEAWPRLSSAVLEASQQAA